VHDVIVDMVQGVQVRSLRRQTTISVMLDLLTTLTLEVARPLHEESKENILVILEIA